MSGLVNDEANNRKEEEGQPLPSEAAAPPDTADETADSAAVKSSAATPSDLDQLLTSERGGEPARSRPIGSTDSTEGQRVSESGPSYKVSPASTSFDNYTLPPLRNSAPDEDGKGSNWQTAWAVVREVGETILLTLVIFLLIQMVVRNFRVVGTSMVDNLHDGQYLIIDKLSYNPLIYQNLGVGGPQRGDVVVFEPPRRPNEDYVKRIIALSGEKVQVIKGEVFVNDELLDEPFLPRTGSYTMPSPVIVPEGEVFVLGDNRNNSNDSHNWGPLPVDNIVGRAWLSYWPPDLWGTIPRDAPTKQATLKQLVGEMIPSANAQSD